jgi:ribose 5-phosphate isomerase B
MAMRLAIACDHAGLLMKQELKTAAEELGAAVLDLGTMDQASVDYPDFADRVAGALAAGEAECGVLVCGTGIGISIAANRHRHVRAALCHDITSARLARQHNDANVLALGARTTGLAVARDCLEAFISTPFEGGRHAKRVQKLA